MFRVRVPAEQQAIHLDVSGEADVVYTVTNTSSKSLPGRAEIRPELGAEPAWFQVAEPRHREFRGEEAQQFKIEVTIPADAPAGTYGFRLVAVNEDNPDEDFAEGESITLHWDPGLVKRIDRTVIALLTLVGIVGLLAISGVIYLVANREIRPPETLRAANRAAAAGQWEEYWDCWTEEGQDELLVRTAGLLEAAEQQDDLEAWMRGYGIRPGDVDGVSGHTMAGDETVVETARLLKERFQDVGRTEKDFFVGAAQWLEDAGEADPSEGYSRAEFRKAFQYELDQAVPIDDDLAQQVAIWDGRGSSPAEQTTLRIVFHKTGRRWLLHDAYPEEPTRLTVWTPLLEWNENSGSAITEIKATRRPVAASEELEYEETVHIRRNHGDWETASLEETQDGDGSFSIKINGSESDPEYTARILPPFLIIQESSGENKRDVFVETGAHVGTSVKQVVDELSR